VSRWEAVLERLGWRQREEGLLLLLVGLGPVAE
jgi:hypothetical protein